MLPNNIPEEHINYLRHYKDMDEQNKINQAPEKREFTKKEKLIALLSSIAILLVVGGGIGLNKYSHKNLPQPVEMENPTGEKQAIPKEAQEFVSKYGDRYSDPVSVYYAETNYKSSVDKFGSIMTDGYINSFEISTNMSGESDEIGFNRYTLPLSAEENQETAVNVFNSYTSKSLNTYMNHLAKNPSQKAEEVIDSEFRNYCSDTGGEGTPMAFSIDDDEINKLMETAKLVVKKYGSAANYSVARASINSDNPNVTSFPGTLTNAEELQNNNLRTRSLQSSGVRLVINVDVFNGKNVTHSVETISDAQLSIIRQQNTGTDNDPADFTYISIGQR